jgi:plasmid stabilization system protein ParE
MISARVLPQAFEDLAVGIDWYNRRRAGLGDDFADHFRSSVKSIQQHPLAHSLIYRDFRRHLFRRFPYSLYYRLRGEEIIIVLIYHLARNPTALRRMLRTREKAA